MNKVIIGDKFKIPASATSDTVFTVVKITSDFIISEYDNLWGINGIYHIEKSLFEEWVMIGRIIFIAQKHKEIDRCVHKYKTYLGFTQSYNYCTKCDHKEGK